MFRLWTFGIYFTLLWSNLGFSCPDGHYEICMLPRPWGGCAQKACIPNGGELINGAADSLADLNQGVIHLGNEVVHTPSDLGKKLSGLENKVSIRDIAKVTFIGSAIINGAACLASGGTSPGTAYVDGSGQSVLVCSSNACSCSILSLYAAYKVNEGPTPEQKQKIEEITNSPAVQSYVSSANFEADMNREIANLGIDKKVMPIRDRPERPSCRTCLIP